MNRKIYLLRHGKPQTEDNKKRCIGLTDVSLSSEGKRQAEAMGEWLAREGIDQIYSSPLSRCKETAAIVGDKIGAAECFVVEGLHEMSVGLWENLTFSEIQERFPKEYEERGNNIGYYAPPGGESFDEAGARFGKCLDEIRMRSQGNILVVAHAGVIRGYLCRILGLPASYVMELSQPYGGVTILQEDEWKRLGVLKMGWKPSILLTEEEIEGIYRKCKTPDKVIAHMKAVADYLYEIKRAMPEEKAEGYDWELLKKAALLHDIKRTEKDHAEASADYLEKEGYHEVAKLVRCHHDAGLNNDELTEEELLFYADKRVQEDQVVTLDERFEKSAEKCLVPEAVEKHRKMFEKAKKIESKIII